MSAFIKNPISNVGSTNTITGTYKKCKIKKGFLPNINPIIYSLSSYESTANVFKIVYITGENLFPFGTTTVNFGSYTNLSVTYYSSFNISFVIPINALSGTYNVQVTSVYNGTSNPNILYSNTVTYTLT